MLALRDQLAAGSLVLAPGCYDLVSARVLRGSGYLTGYLTPFGYKATTPRLGRTAPTAWRNLMTTARTLTSETGVALVVEAHSGIEGSRGPKALVRDVESTGAQAIVVEDRIGLGPASRLRTTQSMLRHIDAVLGARSGDCLIIARSDAVRVSLADAINRCARYLEAGADLVMPLMTPYLEFPRQRIELQVRLGPYRSLASALPPAQVVVHSPHGRHLPVESARELGFGVYLMPQLLIAAAVAGMQKVLAACAGAADGPDDSAEGELPDPAPLARLLTVDSWLRARW
jgi:2-methylisocitrate lyase-like PEP mutase family enzyme